MKMYTNLKYLPIAAFAAVALSLAGCGGGDDDPVATSSTPAPAATPDPTTPPTPPGDTAPTPDEMAADAAAKTKAAGTKEEEIGDEADQTTDAGLGGSVDQGETTTYSMTIERDRDGTTVKIADTALAGDDDPKFMQAMDLGGGRTMHVRTMDADEDGNVVEEVVIVETDIEAPKPTAFATVTGQTLDANTDTTNDDPTETFEALAVANTEVVRELVMSDEFTAGTAAVLTFTFDDPDTMDMDEAFEAAGTYNGADGTYRCNGTDDCTVNINAEGEISDMSGDWVFTPAMGATSDVEDDDYLHYGFWLMRTNG